MGTVEKMKIREKDGSVVSVKKTEKKNLKKEKAAQKEALQNEVMALKEMKQKKENTLKEKVASDSNEDLSLTGDSNEDVSLLEDSNKGVSRWWLLLYVSTCVGMYGALFRCIKASQTTMVQEARPLVVADCYQDFE